MPVREIFLLFRPTLNAITWGPSLSPFACFVVMTAVSTWAPFAWAGRPGPRRMAGPGPGPPPQRPRLDGVGVELGRRRRGLRCGDVDRVGGGVVDLFAAVRGRRLDGRPVRRGLALPAVAGAAPPPPAPLAPP